MLLKSHVSGSHGYALIIVLGLLAILSITAFSLGTASRVDLAQSQRFQHDTAAEFLAKAGVEWAIHYLNDLARQETLWQAPWQRQAAQFWQRTLGPGRFDLTYMDGTGARRYGLQDEEARLNIASASVALLMALPGVDMALAEAIVAQRQQQPWIMPDDLMHRGLVSPAAFYGTAEQPGLAPYLTVWGSGKVNINTAPPEVLATLPGMEAAQVAAIVQHRQGDDQQAGTADDQYFHAVTDLLALPGMSNDVLAHSEDHMTTVSSAFRVIATGRVTRGREQRAEQRHRQLAIIDRSVTPSQLHAWR